MIPMQLLNRIVDSLSEDILNGTGAKTSKFLLGAVMIAFISLSTILTATLIFTCIALLIQSYNTGSITHQTAVFNFLNITQGIKEFNYRCWLMLGFLSAFVPMALPILIKDSLKTTRYQYFSFSIVCTVFIWSIFSGIFGGYIALDSGQDWGELFLLIGIAGIVFCNIEEKNSRWRVYFALLLFAGCIIRAYYIEPYP